MRYLTLAAFLVVGAAPTPAPPAVTPCGAGRAGVIASQFLREVNGLRAARGLTPVALHEALCAIARERARELTAAREVEFDLLSDHELFRRARAVGYKPRLLSELVIQAEGGIEHVVETWPRNARDSALEPEITDLGIGSGRLDGDPLYALFFGVSQEGDFRKRSEGLADREALTQAMLGRVNAERRTARLSPLRLDPALTAAAQKHADDMLARSFYGHETPEGRTPLHRVKAAGYEPAAVAENVARGQYSVEEVMDGWMDSKVHRVNILGRDYAGIGLGFAHGINESGPATYWVQVFGRPLPP